MKVVVLLSGGLDSTTCLALAAKEYKAQNVIALSLYYGQKHDKEVECARDIARYYGVEHLEYSVDEIFKEAGCTLLKGRGEIPAGEYADQLRLANGKPVSTYVPFRNGLFLAIAASMALSRGCERVIYGAHKDDAAGNAYPDCSVDFFEAINNAVYLGTGKAVQIEAPFIRKNKADIVAEGLRINVPYEKTWSCYAGGDKPCGVCGTCIDRAKAFEANGAKDPLEG